MNRTVRSVFFWIHLVLGVVSSAVVIVLCVTGTILAFELPITEWADRSLVEAPAEHAAIPRVVPLVRAAAAGHDGEAPQALTVGRNPSTPAVASWGRRDRTSLDPWTARPVGEGAAGVHGFFRTVMFVHRWFALEGAGRDVARLVTGTCTLLMVFLVPTGLVLWLPRRFAWKRFKANLVPRLRAYGQAFEFEWHHVLGIWMALPLLFVAITGAAIGFHWLNDGLVVVAGGSLDEGERRGGEETAGEPAPLDVRLAGADEALARVASEVPGWTSMELELPRDGAAPWVISVDTGNGRQPQWQESLTLSRSTLAVEGRRGWSDAGRSRQVRTLVRFGHTGEMFGWPGMILAAMASVAGALLAYTGLALSIRRFSRWVRRRSKPLAE